MGNRPINSGFESPFEVAAPAGGEGWEEMYPYHLLVGDERRDFDENRFWFQDACRRHVRPEGVAERVESDAADRHAVTGSANTKPATGLAPRPLSDVQPRANFRVLDQGISPMSGHRPRRDAASMLTTASPTNHSYSPALDTPHVFAAPVVREMPRPAPEPLTWRNCW
jgi:hypothetical protein